MGDWGLRVCAGGFERGALKPAAVSRQPSGQAGGAQGRDEALSRVAILAQDDWGPVHGDENFTLRSFCRAQDGSGVGMRIGDEKVGGGSVGEERIGEGQGTGAEWGIGTG